MAMQHKNMQIRRFVHSRTCTITILEVDIKFVDKLCECGQGEEIRDMGVEMYTKDVREWTTDCTCWSFVGQASNSTDLTDS